MDTSQIKPLNLDDYTSLGVGGSVNQDNYRSRTGILNGQTFSLDILADNIDFLNRLSEETRWMMMEDHRSVPHDYKWVAYLSLGSCETIAQGRSIVETKTFPEPMMGRVDYALVNHINERRMEVIALFENEGDAVYHRLAA